MVIEELADIAIATESLTDFDELVTLPCYHWQHVLVLPPEHPLSVQKKPITLKQLSTYPLVTYHPTFTGRQRIDSAFTKHHLVPNIALEAIDSDVIKTYVRIGMGGWVSLLRWPSSRSSTKTWSSNPRGIFLGKI